VEICDCECLLERLGEICYFPGMDTTGHFCCGFATDLLDFSIALKYHGKVTGNKFYNAVLCMII